MKFKAFYYKGIELCSFSEFGISSGDIDTARSFFAIENGVGVEDILVVDEVR